MCVFGLCMVLPFVGRCVARSLHGAYCSGHRKTARERGDPQDGERMISYFRIQAARPEYTVVHTAVKRRADVGPGRLEPNSQACMR